MCKTDLPILASDAAKILCTRPGNYSERERKRKRERDRERDGGGLRERERERDIYYKYPSHQLTCTINYNIKISRQIIFRKVSHSSANMDYNILVWRRCGTVRIANAAKLMNMCLSLIARSST